MHPSWRQITPLDGVPWTHESRCMMASIFMQQSSNSIARWGWSDDPWSRISTMGEWCANGKDVKWLVSEVLFGQEKQRYKDILWDILGRMSMVNPKILLIPCAFALSKWVKATENHGHTDTNVCDSLPLWPTPWFASILLSREAWTPSIFERRYVCAGMIPKYLKIFSKQVSRELLSVTVPQEESRHVPNLMEWVHPQARHQLQCWIQDHVNAFACGKSCVPLARVQMDQECKNTMQLLMLYHAALCFIVLDVLKCYMYTLYPMFRWSYWSYVCYLYLFAKL